MGPGKYERTITPLAERFQRHFIPEPMSGCWLWFAAVTGPGYGMIGDPARRGRALMAHRVSYEIHVGPIPEGFDLDHLCRVRCCVNPQHLEAVTRRENLLRGKTRTARNAAVTHCPRGHPYDAANTIRTKDGSRTCRMCCRVWNSAAYRHRNRVE